MTNVKILEELISLVREEAGEFKRPIYKETLIENDLGVTGDEAMELISHYSKKFNVDLSNFGYSKYFYSEPGIFNSYKQVQPLSIGDLEEGIYLGKLDDDVIKLNHPNNND